MKVKNQEEFIKAVRAASPNDIIIYDESDVGLGQSTVTHQMLQEMENHLKRLRNRQMDIK